MVEDTVLVSQTDDGKEEREIEILTSEMQSGENVREVGSDVKEGEVILKRGEGITAIGGEFGLLASVGTRKVAIYRKPVVGVLSTGDEIIPHDRSGHLKLGEVRDTNRPTLLTALRGQGFEAVDLGIVSDKYVHSYAQYTVHNPLPSTFFSLTTRTTQTRCPRRNPPLRTHESRRDHNLRWRLYGRARPSKTHHRARPRRYYPFRPREYEARETHDLRNHTHEALFSYHHPNPQNNLLPPRKPRLRHSNLPPLRPPFPTPSERHLARGLAHREGRARRACPHG